MFNRLLNYKWDMFNSYVGLPESIGFQGRSKTKYYSSFIVDSGKCALHDSKLGLSFLLVRLAFKAAERDQIGTSLPYVKSSSSVSHPGTFEGMAQGTTHGKSHWTTMKWRRKHLEVDFKSHFPQVTPIFRAQGWSVYIFIWVDPKWFT